MSGLPLHAGARVGVFGPSGIHNAERLDAACALLRSWQLEPVPAPHLGAKLRYLAGDDDARLEALVWALSDPSLDAAWVARGGYGLTRLLPRVPWHALKPRPVLGFSDTTVLLLALWRRGWKHAIHGPVLHSFADQVDDASREATRALLLEGQIPSLSGRVLVPGEAQGTVLGGNLCMLASLAGTPEALSGQGAIVVLEDVGERPYRVDRLFHQLRQSGSLRGLAGLALGEFLHCEAPQWADWELTQVLRDLAEPLGVPVLTDLPVGHGTANHPWVLGAKARLDGTGLHFDLGIASETS
jgi:muramoyltetrapeptide carboxypeptidase